MHTYAVITVICYLHTFPIHNTAFPCGSTDRWIEESIDQPENPKINPKNEPKHKFFATLVWFFCLVVFLFSIIYKRVDYVSYRFFDNCDLLSVSVACLGRTGALFVAAVSFHCVPKALLACACFACFVIDDADRLQLSNWLKMLDFTVHSMYLRAKYVSVCVCFSFFVCISKFTIFVC